ncbi:N-acetylmuramoyl-L-alanine amidase [Streptomyces sp. VB1]|uniref:N-acetylmuramoyl-L-alanine amidase n=1 Tax=Streptomyces sp. VB1 TaxID=2986803 RepID=UPI002241A4C0|nr:N-acetylmuramoyl-L-alanine amidase [Streptomyces sp. VB1]UZI31588.1 N-acetylmuramoyl-L-alanine amidase [Streptomyces sp. VB1]
MPYDDSPPPTRRARPLSVAAALAAVCLTAAGCGGGPEADGAGTAPPRPGADAASPTAPAPAGIASPTDSSKPLPKGPLTGRTVVIDPGHNPRNRDHTREINEKVDIGTGRKECDTTGTSTDDGYAEARFTLDVSHRLRALLEAEGARVRLTHDGDRPFGPCIDERARIGNEAKADAVVSVHADGSAVGNRGFHVILPAEVTGGGADTSKIVESSADLGARIAGHFVRTTGSEPSHYIGGKTGLDTRNDLGGLNLSTVPKVFVECGNMRDPKDAALLTSGSWRQKAAQGMADGISSYLKG